MEPSTIEDALAAAEQSLASGAGLAGTGFWRAVGQVRAQPELAERYADRIAAIDTEAHRKWALLVVPVVLGTVVMVLATIAGLVLIGLAYDADGLTGVILFYVGFGVLLVTSHGLAHLVVGRLYGMSFTAWFIGELARPQPGVKLDYSSYLRIEPRKRAWMHASGAIVTKILPFALIGSAVAADLPAWAVWGLPVIGLAATVTDVLWSTSKSDWKRFRREMSFAQSS